METIGNKTATLFPTVSNACSLKRDWSSQTVEPAKPIRRPAAQASVSRWRSPTAPRASSILPRITGALKHLVAKPDRRDEMLLLTNSNLMGRERFSERQAAVLNAAARLAEAATLPETDIVRDAAIQRFEFTFELVWKTLQLYLEHEGLESGGPRAVLKRAFVMRLIPDQDEADVWLRMLDDRNLTSHAYDETLAVRIYTRIVQDYAPRLAQMAEKIQTLGWD
jgi:nucleotidyltransferase substrate binding protein (TIGR01987 family)